MAIDTEQKRRCVAGLTFLPVSLKPDGVISQGDRAQIGWGWRSDKDSMLVAANVYVTATYFGSGRVNPTYAAGVKVK